MKIKVTQSHIEAAVREDCEFCPIALALKEAGLTKVSVCEGAISFEDNGLGFYLCHSKDTHAFVLEFDLGGAVTPFEFDTMSLVEPEETDDYEEFMAGLQQELKEAA